MKIKFLVPFLILFLCNFKIAQADSPLTSTGFWEAYSKEKMVKYARSVGKMDKKIATFLMRTNAGMGIKAAVCNALGWKFDGQDNASVFLGFIAAEYHFEIEEVDWELLTAEELACYGYLLAMDDYFKPAAGLETLEKAVKKNSKSLAIQMLTALVKSQMAFEGDWCAVFTIVNSVNEDDSLIEDFNESARVIIMDYIKLYQDSCV